MKKPLLVIFLLLQTFTMFGYDYQTVYSHRTAMYQLKQESNVLGMRIDSVKFQNGDSVFYPLKNIQLKNDNCYTPNGASWLGGKIILNKDWNYFYNRYGDTIKIKTNAKIGESWTLCNKGDVSITAKVESCRWDNFIGMTDSVKVISLSVTGANYPDIIDNIVLSKKYGLVKSYNFSSFPEQKYMYYTLYKKLRLYTLVGITNPNLGLQNLSWFDVYDFQSGDEIHTKYIDISYLPLPPYSYEHLYNKKIVRYLDRKNYADSIVYTVEITKQENGKYSYEKTKEKILPKNSFNKLPSESVIEDNVAFEYEMKSDSFISKKRPPIYDNIFKNENCWSILPFDGCLPDSTYYKGLGGPYYKCEWASVHENSLVYYKKGEKEWGTPLEIVDPNYTPFPTDNVQWNVMNTLRSGQSIIYKNNDHYFVNGSDTLINDIRYHKFFVNRGTDQQPAIIYNGAFREENKRIYYIGNGFTPANVYVRNFAQRAKSCLPDYTQNDNEILLYDFNVKKGDEIHWGYSWDYVGDVDSVKVKDRYRKRIRTSFGDVVEGIGNVSKGLFASMVQISTCTPEVSQSWDFICYSQNGENLYRNTYYFDCEGSKSWADIFYLNNQPHWVNIHYTNKGEMYKDEYFLKGDTVMKYYNNSTVYKKMMRKYKVGDSYKEEYVAAVIDGYGSIIVRIPSLDALYPESGKSLLLYDFRVEVNDSVNIYDISTDTFHYVKIVSTDSMTMMDGTKRKVFHTNYKGQTYIEGIGCNNGFFAPLYSKNNDIADLTCFKENDKQLYINSKFCEYNSNDCCDITKTDVSQLKQINFTISPNPAKDMLKITLNESIYEATTAKIINSLGKTVLVQKLENQEQSVSLKNIPAGIYLLQIEKGNQKESVKFIKQ